MPAPPSAPLVPDLNLFAIFFDAAKSFLKQFWYFIPVAIGFTYLKAKTEQKQEAERDSKRSQRTKQREKDRLAARDEYQTEKRTKAEARYRANR